MNAAAIRSRMGICSPVILWSFPLIHGAACIEAAVKIFADSFFAAFGVFLSACELFSLSFLGFGRCSPAIARSPLAHGSW
jgi:hypothetical protein